MTLINKFVGRYKNKDDIDYGNKFGKTFFYNHIKELTEKGYLKQQTFEDKETGKPHIKYKITEKGMWECRNEIPYYDRLLEDLDSVES